LLESAWSGLAILFQPDSLLYMLEGSMLGIILSLVPGLTGVNAMILLIPLTYHMGASQAMVIMVSIIGASMCGGSVHTILIGIPGAGVNTPTVFDGFPLAKKGRAAEAIGAMAAASAYGGMFGALVLMISLPVMRKIVLLLGPPEYFMIALLGLSIVGSLAGRSILSGLLAVCIGLMMSYVGFNPVVGGERFTFGIMGLWDGIPMTCAFIGLFAVSAVMDMALEGSPIAEIKVKLKGSFNQMLTGVKAPFHHLGLLLRCSAMGTVLGAVPGHGGVVGAFLTYAHAVQSAKDKSMFGKGDIRGVIGPESGKNAVGGGALIPTLSLGIPGSEMTALLLPVLMLHGITPGPEMITRHLDVVWVMVWSLVISHIFGSIISCLASPQLALITRVRPSYLVPIILAVSLIGSYTYNKRMEDVLITLVIGFIGYAMKSYKIPVAAAVMGYILGSVMEKSFFQSLQMGRGNFMVFFNRPISLFLLIVTIVAFFWPYISIAIKRMRTGKTIAGQEQGGD